jgi:hypothetical protein
MAHWAEIDETNKVLRVVVGDNDDPAGDEGYQWLVDNLGGTWVKTSYNTVGGVHQQGGTPLRMNYAAVGGIYDPIRDIFISPKPDDFIDEKGHSFTFKLDENTYQWKISTHP